MTSEIGNWYSKKNILITGATGFIGKVLLEKLLRICPDIGEIFIFVRPKKGKTTEERKQLIIENPIFQKIHDTNPSQFNKIKLFDSELSKNGLNLTETDEEYLKKNCHIIFHVAASVQFDKGLHEISDTNIWGLEHMLELAKQIENLLAFVFCSTAFSQPQNVCVDEIAYESPIKSIELKKLLNNYNEETINPLTIKLLNDYPNTYAYTKSIAENLIVNYSKYFPIAIARPSIVTNMAHDPIPGWAEGIHGLTGWVIVGIFGIIKVVHGNENNPRCVIPVDITVNGLILIGWQIAIKRSQQIEYYNLAEDISIAKFYPPKLCKPLANAAATKYPSDIAVMHFGYTVTQNYLLFKIFEIWYHFIPAILIDSLLILFKREPMVLRAHRKIIYNMIPLKYYMTNSFEFLTKKFDGLASLLNEYDKSLFPLDINKALTPEYYMVGQIGIKKYILKQAIENVPRARKLQKALYIFGRIIYLTIGYWLCKIIYKRFLVNSF